jgi:N-acylneuraminate cytidylyltransferase
MALLGGKPLLQWAIEAAKGSGVFEQIVVSSDWPECLAMARLNMIASIARPPELCQDASHDYEWVKHALDAFPGFDIFVILRPTSPFRTAETIKRAMKEFLAVPCYSMRAVERTTAHPKKSWELGNVFIYPYDSGEINGISYYDLPTQSLGDVYVQNGCIHIAWIATLQKFENVSGDMIRPFYTEGREGIDINTKQDLEFAEWLTGRKE